VDKSESSPRRCPPFPAAADIKTDGQDEHGDDGIPHDQAFFSDDIEEWRQEHYIGTDGGMQRKQFKRNYHAKPFGARTTETNSGATKARPKVAGK